MIDPVPVLCFAAAGVRFAIAAADVLALGDDARSAPAIAVGLGLPDQLTSTCRVVTLASRAGPIDVVVDGPITVRQLAAEQIVPAPLGVPLSPAVVGFARVDGELVQLLEVERVVAGLGPSSRGAS